MGLIRKLKTLQKLSKILMLIDPKKLECINDILERVYPGIQDEIMRLVEGYDIHAMSKTLDYIKAHGGAEKMAEYYNGADHKGQQEVLSAFNMAFKPRAPFEDAVLMLDSLAKVKDMGLYVQLFGDIKDSIIVTSIKCHYRTVDDWRTFVRRQREANKDVMLGILDEIGIDEEQQETPITEQVVMPPAEENIVEGTHEEEPPGDDNAEYPFPMGLLSELYAYNGNIFKSIPSEYEFIGIILRKPHTHKLVECTGKKALMYRIIERLSRLLPEEKRKPWREDIAKECGYDVTTISKKFNDVTNMKPENLKLSEELNRLFDSYDTQH